MYKKNQFGIELKQQIEGGYDVRRISNWAYQEAYTTHRTFEDGLYDVIMTVVMMEMGHEFELSEAQLLQLANDMINFEG